MRSLATGRPGPGRPSGTSACRTVRSSCVTVRHMTSIRHNPSIKRRPEDTYLDAARDAILAVGWSRTTLTDIARRSGVSRMTLYRRWPDTQTLLADLMTREWGVVVE